MKPVVRSNAKSLRRPKTSLESRGRQSKRERNSQANEARFRASLKAPFAMNHSLSIPR